MSLPRLCAGLGGYILALAEEVPHSSYREYISDREHGRLYQLPQLKLPPAFRILSLAFSVTLRAHTVILGMSKILEVVISTD